jgi:hypothetical protein
LACWFLLGLIKPLGEINACFFDYIHHFEDSGLSTVIGSKEVDCGVSYQEVVKSPKAVID